MPVAAALGIRAEFICDSGLLCRPIDEMINVLSAHGEKIEKQIAVIFFRGKFIPGSTL